MRNPQTFLALLVFISCTGPKPLAEEPNGGGESATDSTKSSLAELLIDEEEEQRRTELRKQATQTRRGPRLEAVDVTGEPCDSKTLLYVSENLDSLTEEGIIKFLNTFSEECRNNAEFSEWSNELLFDVMMSDVDLYMKAWLTRGLENIDLIMEEIKYPIVDVLYQSLYDSIRVSNASKDLIDYHLEALVFAAKSENEPIEEHF